MVRLERLMLKGFKSIREMDLELSALNVLIGPNGAGKSNLLSFFRLLGAASQQRLPMFIGKEGGGNAILHHGSKRTPRLQAEVSFRAEEHKLDYRIELVAAAPDTLILDKEEIASQHIDPRGAGAETIAGLAFYHFHDTTPEAPIKQGCQLNDNRALRHDGGNLAAFLYMLQHAHRARYERIRDTIRLAAPFFDDFVLEPSALNPNMIQIEWREIGSDQAFFAHQLSDGTLRFIALTTALLQPPELAGRPHTIIIDEPELGLHPYAITLLASMMRSASQATQLIVSTQSVTLLDELAEPEEVIVVERKDKESSFRRLDPEALKAWLDEYTLGELWEKNVLGGRP